MKTLKVKVTFIEELLGTASADPNIHREYIASKAPDALNIEEEIAALGIEEVTEKAMTIFPKENGKPFLFDYQWKGFLKDACGALRKIKGTKSAKITAYKKVIDKLIFPKPRKIFLTLPEGCQIGNCQRPLRGQTAQGERIALANSETVPAGTTSEFEILLLDESQEDWIKELLEYGELGGTGQWRNSGKGRFTVEFL